MVFRGFRGVLAFSYQVATEASGWKSALHIAPICPDFFVKQCQKFGFNVSIRATMVVY